MGKKRVKDSEYKLTHDAFFDETFGVPVFGVAFLKAKLPRKLKKHLDIDSLIVEKEKFRDDHFRETRPDIVYKVPIRGIDDHISFYVIAEHKSYDDHSAIFQLWGYVCRLCVRDVKKRLTDPETKQRRNWPKHFRLSPIIPIIIYHGNKPFTGETQLADLFYQIPGAREYLPHLQAILVDLAITDEGNLPRDPNAPELHVVLLIMKVIFSKAPQTIKSKFREILKELKPYSQNPKYRELIRKLWRYVIYNAEKLTEADAEEIHAELREITGDNDMPTLVQMWTDKGKAEGEAKGKAEGQARTITRLLTRRFGVVPQDVEMGLLALRDIEQLDRLSDFAFDCHSLEEFASHLR
jgi:predicted transposase YdaD